MSANILITSAFETAINLLNNVLTTPAKVRISGLYGKTYDKSEIYIIDQVINNVTYNIRLLASGPNELIKPINELRDKIQNGSLYTEIELAYDNYVANGGSVNIKVNVLQDRIHTFDNFDLIFLKQGATSDIIFELKNFGSEKKVAKYLNDLVNKTGIDIGL